MRGRPVSARGTSRAAFCLALATILAGCASAGLNGVAGERTPLAIKEAGRSDAKYTRRREESERLRGVEGVWRRGEALVVDTTEGIQYSLIDAGTCEGYYTCRRWTFRGSAQAAARSADVRRSKYWLIELEHGEGGYWLAIHADGGDSIALADEPQISPDGHTWAAGFCNEELDGSSLEIWDSDEYGRMGLAAKSGDTPCCDILGWDGTALKVKSCHIEPDKVFNDTIVRQVDGRWAGARIRLGAAGGP